MSQFHSPRIVTDGLVLMLDAANVESYPGSGTLWLNLAGTTNGTLTNGPTFDVENGGSIVFDGINDYVNIPRNPNYNYTPLSSFTMNVWAKVNGMSGDFTANRSTSVFGRGSTGGSFGIGMQRNTNNTFIWAIGSRPDSDAPTQTTISYVPGRIDNITFVYTPTFQYIYRNGVLVNTQSTSDRNTGSFDANDYAMGIARAVPGGNSAWMDGSVYLATMYNRALTAEEVLQNYNATKGRFGL